MSTASNTTQKHASALDTIDEMLRSIDGVTKSAEEANTEAGGYQGATEHQSKNEDDRTEDSREGSRSAENESDIKKDQGAPGVDGKDVNASLSLPGNQDDVQMDIGVTSKATGEDPQNETNRAKPGKEDSDDGDGGSQGRGQTSHPARTSNDEIDGRKWSSAADHVLSLIKQAETAGNEALAAISVEADEAVRKQAENLQTDEQKAALASQRQQQGEKRGSTAQAAGAAAASGQVDTSDKQAQDAQVIEDVAATILDAYAAADKTASYVRGIVEAQKQAMEEEGEGGEEGGEDPPGNPSEAGDGAPPDALGGMPPGGGGGEEEALMQALMGGGEEMGGGMPGGEMGGGMPGGEMGGGMPGGEMGGGGEIPPEQLEMLLAALQEAGVDPGQLEAGAAAKAASQLKQKQASGELVRTEWRPKTAAEARRYQSILNYVREVAKTR